MPYYGPISGCGEELRIAGTKTVMEAEVPGLTRETVIWGRGGEDRAGAGAGDGEGDGGRGWEGTRDRYG